MLFWALEHRKDVRKRLSENRMTAQWDRGLEGSACTVSAKNLGKVQTGGGEPRAQTDSIKYFQGNNAKLWEIRCQTCYRKREQWADV